MAALMSIHDPKTRPHTVANTHVDRRGDPDPIESEPARFRQNFEQPVLRPQKCRQYVAGDFRKEDGGCRSADFRRRLQKPVEHGAGEIHSERALAVRQQTSGTRVRKGGWPRGKVYFGGNCQMNQALRRGPGTGLGAHGESCGAGSRYQTFGALRVRPELLAQFGELGVHGSMPYRPSE